MKKKLLVVLLALVMVLAFSTTALGVNPKVDITDAQLVDDTAFGAAFDRAVASGTYNYANQVLTLTSNLALEPIYYLVFNISDTLTIDLNGYTLSGNVYPYNYGTFNYYGMMTILGGELIITGDGAITNQHTNPNATGFSVGDGALLLESGSLSAAYGVDIYADGIFTMEGGSIKAGDVGVYMYYGGQFIMEDGSIKADDTGVYMYDGGQFTMEDGSINAGYTGVYIYYGGQFTMEDGSIEAGHTGVNMYYGGQFTMHGGSIYASDDGSIGINNIYGDLLFEDIAEIDIYGEMLGIYVWEGSLTFDNIQGGSIRSDNIAVLLESDEDYIEPTIKSNTNYSPELQYGTYDDYGPMGYVTSFGNADLKIKYDNDYDWYLPTNAADTVYFGDDGNDNGGYDWVLAAAAAGYYATNPPYITGFPDGTFRAGANVTRGQISTMFTKAAKLSTGIAAGNYKDVAAGDWDNIYIAAVTNAGVAHGYPDGTFRSLNHVTFAEAITMAGNAFSLSNTATANAPYDGIATHWAKDAVNAAHAAGWLQNLGSFRLDAYATRGDLVLLINAAADLNNKTIVEYGPSFSDIPAGHSLYDAVTRASSKLR